MTSGRTSSVFVSHNANDKEHVRRLAAALAATGSRVWLDEWVIRPGDSIPGAIDQGLAQFEIFALVWSAAACKSQWVRTEMEAAIAIWVKNPSLRIVPIILDHTPLPTLLAPLRYIDATDGNHSRIARELLGLESGTAYRMAVQAFIDDAGLDFREFLGVGVMVACRRCGAPAGRIEAWHQVDHQHERSYVGAQCEVCGWSEGSET